MRAILVTLAALLILAAVVAGCGGGSGKPSGGTAKQADFCSNHACIPSFYNGSGYIVQCNDGMWSHSGGEPGACSYHGGER